MQSYGLYFSRTCLLFSSSKLRISSKSWSRPSTSGRYLFRDRSKSPCWESRQISAHMACPMAWVTESSQRPRRLMKWSRPSSLKLTDRAPLLSLTFSLDFFTGIRRSLEQPLQLWLTPEKTLPCSRAPFF